MPSPTLPDARNIAGIDVRSTDVARTRATHTPEHVREVIAILRAYPGAQVAGLPAAVRELRDSLNLDAEDMPAVHFVPDAFRLNHEAREIELFEVEVTHPLPVEKLRDLGNWWAEWEAENEHDWLPVLIQVDRFGNRTRRDLGIIYFELCTVVTA